MSLPPAAFLSFLASLFSLLFQAPQQDRLLRMQAILGFVIDNRLGSIDHVIRDFLAAVCWQAVHEDRARIGSCQQFGIDTIGFQKRPPSRSVLVTHGNPGVGDDAIGTGDGVFGVMGKLYFRPRIARPFA